MTNSVMFKNNLYKIALQAKKKSDPTMEADFLYEFV